nr:hypothetical protein [Bacillus atrophaeus]
MKFVFTTLLTALFSVWTAPDSGSCRNYVRNALKKYMTAKIQITPPAPHGPIKRLTMPVAIKTHKPEPSIRALSGI